MSKAALYKGLGVGLMSFGDNLSQQMAQSAEQRRQESLLALKRQWQLEDREYQETREDARRTEDRNWDIEQEALRHNLATGRTLMEHELTADQRAVEEARAREAHDADVLNTQARTQAAETLAESRRRQSEVGDDGLTAAQRNESLRFRRDTRQFVERLTPELFRVERGAPLSTRTFVAQDRQTAERLGITPDTPLLEAIEKVENDLFERRMEHYGPSFGIDGGPMEVDPDMGNGSRNSPIPVDALSDPSQLEPGMFYMVDGQVMEWTSQGWR